MRDVLKWVSNTADGVFAIDSECRIILWNKAAQEVLGFSPEEVRGKFCFEILPGEDPAGNSFCFKGCSIVSMAKEGRLVKNYTVQMTTKAGQKIWLNVSIVLIPTPKEKSPILIHQFRPVPAPAGVEGLVERVASRVLEALHIKGQDNETNPANPTPKGSLLSRREIEVLTLMTQCLGTKEIAARLFISHATVGTHIQHILKKLQVHSKVEAVAIAFHQNLIPTLPFEPVKNHASSC